MTGLEATRPIRSRSANTSPRTYLTEPPPGYRKPTATATATIDAPKEQPDAGDAQAYIRSQQHKTSVDQ